MSYRQRKNWNSKQEKLEALKALRGQHDQRIRCGVIEILYGQRGETARFLEAAISKLELEALRERALEVALGVEEQRPMVKAKLWSAGVDEDGD